MMIPVFIAVAVAARRIRRSARRGRLRDHLAQPQRPGRAGAPQSSPQVDPARSPPMSAPTSTRSNFMRIVAETTAAVLGHPGASPTRSTEWWVALLLSALIMTAASFVLVGSSPRSVGRAHPEALVRITRAARARRAGAARADRERARLPRQQGDAGSAEDRGVRQRTAAAQHGRRGHRAAGARGRRPRAHPFDLRVQRDGGARGDDPAHRHGHHRRRRLDQRRDGPVPQQGRVPGAGRGQGCRRGARHPVSAGCRPPQLRAPARVRPADRPRAGPSGHASCRSRRRPTPPCGRCSSRATTW